jgi:phosphoribosylformylglycinamidine cyclo-ligase
MGLDVTDRYPADGVDASVAEVLLRPHRSYAGAVLPLLTDGAVHALAHITGGGILENLDRALPPGLSARVERGSWPVPAEFVAVAEHGGIHEDEMMRTFNMGVGMILVVEGAAAEAVAARLRASGERAWLIGSVDEGERPVVLTGEGNGS